MIDDNGGTDPTGVQTEYVVALYMNLLPASLVQTAGDRLAQLVEANGDHLDTGYLGTDELLNVLTDTGHSDVAYAVLTQTTFPSWGYEIARGATAFWERWDGLPPSGGFQTVFPGASLDGEALAGVGDWLFTDLAGIQALSPGYGVIRIAPYLPASLTSAAASVETVRGLVASHWTQNADGSIELDVTIPVNSIATVVVPAAAAYQITEGGTPVADVSGITVVGTGSDGVTLAVGSGSYSFVSNPYAQPSGRTPGASAVPWAGPPATAPSTADGGSTPSTPQGGQARRVPRGLILRATVAGSGRRGPFEVSVDGRLLPPPGVTRAAGCRGFVAVVIRAKGRVVLSAAVGLTRTCTFRRGVLFAGRRWDGSRGVLAITATFGGNHVLRPLKRPSRTQVTYG